ncbi:hypothetical protein T492DRAFT_831419 [Pavlovales sp. CCMP2436]|nr:hypothetical protein T492DRAFT_831419 [Pavlovales sp. CCMP2436]
MTRLTKSTIAAEARTAQPALEPAQKLTRPATGSVGGLMRLFQRPGAHKKQSNEKNKAAGSHPHRVSAAEAAIPDEAVSKPKSRLGGFSRLWKPTAAAEAKQKAKQKVVEAKGTRC